MTAATADAPRAPWHLWVVGVVSVLWNGFGACDYIMSHTGDAYLRSMGMNDSTVAAYHAMPMWMTVDWTVGVWGSVLGSVLLLLRMRWAFHAFVVSLAGLVISICYYHLTANGRLMAVNPAISAMLTVICILFAAYSWAMARRGVLR
jgi:hypothetical protein